MIWEILKQYNMKRGGKEETIKAKMDKRNEKCCMVYLKRFFSKKYILFSINYYFVIIIGKVTGV